MFDIVQFLFVCQFDTNGVFIVLARSSPGVNFNSLFQIEGYDNRDEALV